MKDTTQKDIQTPKTEQDLAQEFAQKYQKLVDEYKLQLVANPVFMKRDDGTYSIVVQVTIGKVVQNNLNQ